ncbi:hypothetical protein B0T16DRAFT_101784 [Cercophora newfieldiana]|uniref:Uncharacterized protein n=1 Tax=Cercophora newfieldiana TaxID=92897 RepID=A0AA40CV15_9PEZI|nr:hypothetical protein B0T16DRAFT_101784 [Cercophora newfieldiana]
MARSRLGRKALWAVTPAAPDTSDGPNYKPVFLKLPFLVFFALYVAALIGVLEYVCRGFPTSLERQDIPDVDEDGDSNSLPTVLLTAPLINPRQTQHAPIPPQQTPGPWLSKRASRRWRGKRSENTTSTSNATSMASLLYADLDPDDNVAHALLPPPRKFAEREAYGPGFLALLQPPEHEGWNQSQTFNGSSLRKRIPDASKYGRLSGPTVGINFFLTGMGFNDIVISTITYERESSARESGVDLCPPMEDTWMSQGLVTCDGPAMIFHDEDCFRNWKTLSDVQRQRREEGFKWEVTEFITDYGEQKFPTDIPVICAAPGQKMTYISGVGLEDDGYGLGDEEETTAPREITQTVRDEQGSVIATLTGAVDYIRDASGKLVPVSTRIRDIPGFTPTDQPFTTVFTNSNGVGTKTITSFGPGAPTTIMLRDGSGKVTGTITVGVPPPKITVTQTGSDGRLITTAIDALEPARPTRTAPTVTPPLSGPAGASDMFHSLTSTEYFLILFLPVSLGTVCSILAEMVYSELRALLPFHSLIRPGGATVGFSLVMSTGGISGVVNSFRLLFQFREPLAFMTDVLVFSSASITTLLSEAVGIQLRGACTAQSFSGCFMGIGAFIGPSRAVQALLGLNLVILFSLFFLLHRWRSGVSVPPRSIMATAALMQDSNLRQLFLDIGAAGEDGGAIKQKEIAESLRQEQFFLRPFHDHKQSAEDYGIVTRTRGPDPLSRSKTGLSRLKTGFSKLTKSSSISALTGRSRRFRDWLLYQGARTNRLVDLMGLLYLCGLLALIVYYNSVTESNSGFEGFMNDQNFGVRVLFTAFGVALTFFWDHYYARAAMSEPYRQLWLRPRSARTSVMVSPPTSVFTGGLVGSLKRGEVWLTIVGFTNILSKITPMLLSNIPFSPIQTWEMHLVCAWTTVSCLGLMSLVIICGFFFIKHPPLPVDPASLAGRIYYLCDSHVADEFQGMSRMNRAECESKVDMEKRYRFGKMIGVSGELRVGVDTAYAWERDGESDERTRYHN